MEKKRRAGRLALNPAIRYVLAPANGKLRMSRLLLSSRKWMKKADPVFIFTAMLEYIHSVFVAINGDDIPFDEWLEFASAHVIAAFILLGCKEPSSDSVRLILRNCGCEHLQDSLAADKHGTDDTDCEE